jgi:hypothetical protein
MHATVALTRSASAASLEFLAESPPGRPGTLAKPKRLPAMIPAGAVRHVLRS